MGLGLTVVKKFYWSLDGGVHVASEAGKRSTLP